MWLTSANSEVVSLGSSNEISKPRERAFEEEAIEYNDGEDVVAAFIKPVGAVGLIYTSLSCLLRISIGYSVSASASAYVPVLRGVQLLLLLCGACSNFAHPPRRAILTGSSMLDASLTTRPLTIALDLGPSTLVAGIFEFHRASTERSPMLL